MKIEKIIPVLLIAFLPMVIRAQNQKVDKADDVYEFVDVSPEFRGGTEGLRNFLAQNMEYPKEAAKKGIQGKVFVQFVVEKDGSVGRVKLKQSVDPLLDQEAIRVVKSMPKWKPGQDNGKPVAVQYTVPLNFALKEKTKN